MWIGDYRSAREGGDQKYNKEYINTYTNKKNKKSFVKVFCTLVTGWREA